MAAIEKVTGVMRPVKIDGREWRLSPLTLEGWGEFMAWAKSAWIDDQKRHSSDLPEDDRRMILSEAFRRLGTIDIDSPEVDAMKSTPEGGFRIIHLSLRKEHDIGLEEVRKVFGDMDTLVKLVDIINEVNSDDVPKKKATKTKKRAGKKVSRRK